MTSAAKHVSRSEQDETDVDRNFNLVDTDTLYSQIHWVVIDRK